MYVEDAIKEFDRRQAVADDALGVLLRSDSWGSGFIKSLAESVGRGSALSTRQATFFLNLVKKHRDAILTNGCGYSSIDLDRIVMTPAYKQQPYESIQIVKEVRYLGDDKLGFRFKRDDGIKEFIKRMRMSVKDFPWRPDLEPKFDYRHRMWVIPVYAGNFKKIMNMIGDYGFGFDDDVAGYLALCEASINQPPTAVLDPESDQIVVNLCDNDALSAWMVNVMRGQVI